MRFKKIIYWTGQNRLEFLAVVAVLAVAAFLRFYRLPEYMTFLGDEGRDALVVKRLLVDHHLPLIGPPTSVGNMYLGPLYYYMMAVAIAIFWLNPVAAAGMVAVIGVLTVGLIYYLAREWFGMVAAFLGTLLYAVSPINIIYSRSSWNPNPAPFFALLAVLGLFKAHRTGNFRWIILTGGSVAAAIQMHYLALILLPVFFILWIYELSLIWQKKLVRRYFVSGTLGACILFLILMSPLVVFDTNHNFINYRAMSAFFMDRQTTVNVNIFNTLSRILPVYSHNLVGRYMTAEQPLLTIIVAIAIIFTIVIALVKKIRGEALRWPYLMLGVWLLIGVIGLSLYKQTLYDHYLGFLNPAPYLVLAGLIGLLNNRLKLPVALILLVVLGFVNLQKNPLLTAPNNQLVRTQDITRLVIKESQNDPFNFALISAHNYDAAYQYYLDIFGHRPKMVPFDITDQLFVVCEDKVCNPVGHPKYEIAAFGWTKIESQRNFGGVKVFKLIHNIVRK